jgi:hypothetical protein
MWCVNGDQLLPCYDNSASNVFACDDAALAISARREQGSDGPRVGTGGRSGACYTPSHGESV